MDAADASLQPILMLLDLDIERVHKLPLPAVLLGVPERLAAADKRLLQG